ncbi:hypothetical protein [Lysobacter sp. CA196]|uniref:hypothetical protein n=1 Tax=Lysobacter sp. CA196 TaxID=3455606 RepID=UPI003F8D0935
MSIFSKLFGSKPTGSEHAAPMDLVTFAERYAAAVRTAWPEARVEIGHGAATADTRVDWHLPDGFKATHFLGNSYLRYLGAPQELDAIFAEQLAGARAIQRDFVSGPEAANAVILPVLKTRGWHETALQQARSFGTESMLPFIVEPLAGDLVLTYVEDTPDSMSFLSPSEAERRGLDRESLYTQALDNLTRFLPELDVQGGGGRYVARLDRNYDASMVLLFDHWRDRIEIKGDPVFAIAARDELMLCGSEDDDSVASLRDIADEIALSSSYNLSRALFTHRDGGLQVFAS